MKKILSIILTVLICLSLTGCAEKPEASLNSYLEVIQGFDEAKMKEYKVYDEVISSSGISSSSISEEEMNQIYKDILSGFTYEIGETNIDADNATVNVSITNSDMTDVVSNYMDALMSYSKKAKSSKLTQEKLEEKTIEILLAEIKKAKESNKTKTTEVAVNMNKVDGNWEISDSTELIDAALGGLGSGSESQEEELDLSNLQK